MSKSVLFILLAISSNGLKAEWVKINTNDNLTTYVDPASISKLENIVKMWGMVDLKEAKKEELGKSFLSAKSLQEYDCKEEQVRKITLSFYSENMGAGEIVHTYTEPDKWKWTPVTHGAIAETMWKTACGKK
jgi:hypothetical protein